MKKNRKLKIWVSVIVAVVIAGICTYQATYNVVAPVVFDFIVGRNPDVLLKLSGTDTVSQEEEKTEETEKSEEEKTEEAGNEAVTDDKKPEKKEELYSSETYIGTLTSTDLAKVIKAISPADKTRIISICRSCVASKDLPRFARMATKGMTREDMAYAESYLRAALTPAQKVEILEIVKKYLN